MSSTTEGTVTESGQAPVPTAKPESEMSDIDRIKAAHAARRSRRSRPPRPPSTSVISLSSSDDQTNSTSTNTSNGNGDDNNDTNGDGDGDKKLIELQQEISNLCVELSSLRRNHLQNLKVITEQRDMFAEQLSKEQEKNIISQQNGGKKQRNDIANDLEAQLRAARIRNSDLENENVILRNEVKQLNFRVQASKTLDAASNGYQTVVDDLVETKLKCAQLSEEKEDLLRINKELSTTSNVLSNANGELEKSRSQWVLQCAEVERKRTELENLLQEKNNNNKKSNNDTSNYSSSDLQELKL